MIKQVKLHSSYNPQKEAERFCAAIQGNPKIIVITEPGESYLAPILRRQFPYAKLIAMRYTDNYFLNSDQLWDKVWRPATGNPAFFLINNIPDEFLSSSLFLPWKAAENIWPDSAYWVWKEISEAIRIMQSVIATRSFFGKKWLKNMGENFIFAKKLADLNLFAEKKETDKENYFFAGAGPGLDKVLNNCSKTINTIFTIAAASALPALDARSINVNLCISTDGGYWAGNHLKYLSNDKFNETALAFPLEAKIPYNILKKNLCIFLSYGSSLESLFFKNLGIEPIYAKRNGTVSGTAIDLLLDHTNGRIFIAGLDLKGSKGFYHCIPHESLRQKETQVNRLDPVSNFAAISNFDLRSLKTYEKWFARIPKIRADRLFKIGNNIRPLGNIKAVSEEEFKIEILSGKEEGKNSNKAEEKKLKILESKPLEEKKSLLSEIYKDIKQEIKNGIFFDKIIVNAKEKNISTPEKELCEFISFQNYIIFLKEKDTHNEKEIKLKLENEITSFLDNQIKRLRP